MSLVANDSCVEPRFAPMSQSDDWIIRQAIALLEQRVFKKGPSLERPAAVKDYLRLKLVAEPNEIFAAVFLNSILGQPCFVMTGFNVGPIIQVENPV